MCRGRGEYGVCLQLQSHFCSRDDFLLLASKVYRAIFRGK